jgi:hypothetical protein
MMIDFIMSAGWVQGFSSKMDFPYTPSHTTCKESDLYLPEGTEQIKGTE